MPAILQDNVLLTIGLLLNPTELRPSRHPFHLAGETAGQSDSQSPQWSGGWHKRENTDHSDTEDDVELHELMEDIKRYIRSIDISNL
jgi:hypothetical protein